MMFLFLKKYKKLRLISCKDYKYIGKIINFVKIKKGQNIVKDN